MIDINKENITYKDINELLYVEQARESEILEFKRELHTKTKEFAKDITAFANAKSGQIIFGIDEKENTINGISDSIGNQKFEDWLSNIVNDLVLDNIDYQIKLIPFPTDKDELYIIVLNVEESKNKPIYVDWDKKTVCFIRKGTSIFSAKPNEIRQMYENRNQQTKSDEININQKAKGKDIFQVGVNSGTIIKTNKVTRKNEIKPNPDIHISEQQAKQIKEKIDEIVLLNEEAGKIKHQNDKGRFYKQTWNSFYQRFNLTSYKMLAKSDFEEALKWLQKQIAFEHRPKLRKGNNNKWKNDLYSAIYAKSGNDLGMDKEDLMNYAFEKLGLKKPISSLKELSDTRLSKLYKYIFSE